jgi:hypothetical protein
MQKLIAAVMQFSGLAMGQQYDFFFLLASKEK